MTTVGGVIALLGPITDALCGLVAVALTERLFNQCALTGVPFASASSPLTQAQRHTND